MTPTVVYSRLGFVYRCYRMFVLLPARLWIFSVSCAILWVESVVHILICFLLNVRLGARASPRAAEEASSRSRISFVNDWLKVRPCTLYPEWFMKFHDMHLCVARFVAKVTLFCFGYKRLVVKGKRSPKADVLVCNHRGIIDSLVLTFALNQLPIFVSGSSLIEFPFIREISISVDVYFIDESMRKFAVRELTDIITYSTNRRPIIMFPEGSADYGTSLRQWIHPGCFQIVPVDRMQGVALTFQGLGEFSPTWPSSSKLHVLFAVLFSLAQIPSNRARVYFVEPNVPEHASRTEMMECYRRDIAYALNVPCEKNNNEYEMPRRGS